MSSIAYTEAIDTSARPLTISEIDVGFGCTVTQSSALSPETKAAALFPANTPGGWFFHTALEERPYITVDLGRVFQIAKVKIWNREDAGISIAQRASSLSIQASNDQNDWREIEAWTGDFGGRSSGMPLCMLFSENIQTRYIRVEGIGSTYLHFDYIEIIQNVPKLSYGFCHEMYIRNRIASCVYFHTYNSGLFSGCSTALHDVIKLAKHDIIARRIDFTASFQYFKDRKDEDQFSVLFARANAEVDHALLIDQCKLLDFDCHDVHRAYSELPLQGLNKVVKFFFSPSATAYAMALSLIKETKLDLDNTIAVVYRGTDKGTEVVLAPIEEYILLAESIRERSPSMKVLIQTDQEQARQHVYEAFGEDCIFFRDMPTTASDTAIHHIDSLHGAAGRSLFALRIMAAVLVLARCKYLILHTGNVAAWVAIYRGNSDNLYQFDQTGVLILPHVSPILDNVLSSEVSDPADYARQNGNTLFDPAFYLSLYADVRGSGIDPFLHYVRFGFCEGRIPCSDTAMRAYIERQSERIEIDKGHTCDKKRV